MNRTGTFSTTIALAAAAAATLTAATASAETFPYRAPVDPTDLAPSTATVVPAGARFAAVDIYGAQGGGAQGGKGAHVTATIAVTPGEVLHVYVGGAPTNFFGGYNGGGLSIGGGPGGGASDIRLTDDPSTRVVVAGGGGGGASSGGGGGASDTRGQDGGSANVDGKGGASGSASGIGGAAGSGTGPGASTGQAGGSASNGMGGTGVFTFGGSSGGGGGGLVGGGAGGTGGTSLTLGGTKMGKAAGGGGGSSKAPGGTIQEGSREGNGVVTITYSSGTTGSGVKPSSTVVKDTVKPSLGSFGLSRSSFAAASSGASASAKKKGKKTVPVGTKVTYSLSEAATTTFTVERKSSGRKSGRKCVKPTRRNRKKTKCTRYTKVSGSFAVKGKKGTNSFTFSGRLAGKKLAPGSYRLNGTARDLAGNLSAVRQRTFTIVK